MMALYEVPLLLSSFYPSDPGMKIAKASRTKMKFSGSQGLTYSLSRKECLAEGEECPTNSGLKVQRCFHTKHLFI